MKHACMSEKPQEFLSYKPLYPLHPTHRESSHVTSAAHQRQSHLHIPHLLFTRAPFIIKDNFMDRFFHVELILIKRTSNWKHRNQPRGQHLLVCVAEARVLGKYCMQIKCKGKQKKAKEVSAVCRKQVSYTQHFGFVWCARLFVRECFWGRRQTVCGRQC